LQVIEAEFASTSTEDERPAAPRGGEEHPGVERRDPSLDTRHAALDRAWRELHALQLDRPDDRDRLVAAASSPDVATRQVTARLLLDVDPEVAHRLWAELLEDASRTVRRATVDAMVDADRPALGPLLEDALADSDAWTRWKALRGLLDLGLEPSRDVLQRLATDADFRVRVEARNALRKREQS
jgi:HEAT repeat protein